MWIAAGRASDLFGDCKFVSWILSGGPGNNSKGHKEVRLLSKRKAAPFAIAVLILGALVATGGAQAPQTPAPVKAVQLTGLTGVSKIQGKPDG